MVRNGSGTSPSSTFPVPFRSSTCITRQHLWNLARKLHPNDEPQQRRWIMIHQDQLDEGHIEELVLALRSIDCPNQKLAEEIREEANYFEKNTQRMRYPEFRL